MRPEVPEASQNPGKNVTADENIVYSDADLIAA